jgi:hypothetical protein
MQVRHKRAPRANGGTTTTKPPVKFDATQAIIARLQKRLNATFITYWNSVQGSICHNDVVVLHQLLRKAKRGERVMMFIKSDGGKYIR